MSFAEGLEKKRKKKEAAMEGRVRKERRRVRIRCWSRRASGEEEEEDEEEEEEEEEDEEEGGFFLSMGILRRIPPNRCV